MALSTSGPNLVLLEESEPNSPFIALTTLTLRNMRFKSVVNLYVTANLFWATLTSQETFSVIHKLSFVSVVCFMGKVTSFKFAKKRLDVQYVTILHSACNRSTFYRTCNFPKIKHRTHKPSFKKG